MSEAIIKRALDGTFTRIEAGKTITVKVPANFLPKHDPNGRQVGESHEYLHYSEDEDTIILELRRRRMAAWEIAERLKRTEESVRTRIRRLEGRL